jgi:hypothetical protein
MAMSTATRVTRYATDLLVALLLCVATVWIACASNSEYSGSWMGRRASELETRWGPPNDSAELNDGRSVRTWITDWTDRYGTHTCRRTFTVDTEGRIERWSFTNCPRW